MQGMPTYSVKTAAFAFLHVGLQEENALSILQLHQQSRICMERAEQCLVDKGISFWSRVSTNIRRLKDGIDLPVGLLASGDISCVISILLRMQVTAVVAADKVPRIRLCCVGWSVAFEAAADFMYLAVLGLGNDRVGGFWHNEGLSNVAGR